MYQFHTQCQNQSAAVVVESSSSLIKHCELADETLLRKSTIILSCCPLHFQYLTNYFAQCQRCDQYFVLSFKSSRHVYSFIKFEPLKKWQSPNTNLTNITRSSLNLVLTVCFGKDPVHFSQRLTFIHRYTSSVTAIICLFGIFAISILSFR